MGDDLTVCKKECADLRSELGNTVNDCTNLQNENLELQERLNDLEQHKDLLQDNLNDSQEENESLRLENGDLQDMLTDAQEMKDELQDRIREMQKNNRQLCATINAMEEDGAMLKEEISEKNVSVSERVRILEERLSSLDVENLELRAARDSISFQFETGEDSLE